MDKETFEKVAKLSEDIRNFWLINKKISDATLSFVSDKGYETLFTRVQKDMIKDILYKHEVEIKKELNDWYNDLKKQVEEL